MGEKTKLQEMLEKKEKIRQGGGEKKVAKQHGAGKLTARERIDLLFDPGTFQEYNIFMKHRCHDFGMEKVDTPAEGVVTGYGLIHGRGAFAFAHDFTVLGGAMGEMQGMKVKRIQELAMDAGVPLIGLNDSGGGRIQEGPATSYGAIFFNNVMASGVIPQISAIMGPCAGGTVYSPALTDFIFSVDKTSRSFITGPQVIKNVTGEVVDAEKLGGARTHNTVSGVSHFFCADDRDCIEKIKTLLSYLPPNCREMPPIMPCGDSPDRRCEMLNTFIPDNLKKAYDIKDVIREIADGHEFFETQAMYATNMVTGFIRMNGRSVGVVANQPKAMAGCIDINASDKAARFIRTCDCFNVPLLSIADVPGYMPGTNQEYGGIIRHGAKMIYAWAEATVPKIVMAVGKVVGGARPAMCSWELRPDFIFAWPTAQMVVVGAEGAVDICRKHELKRAEESGEDVAALRAHYIEESIADVPGYMPGTNQEYGGIIRHGAKMIYAWAEATVPKIVMAVGKVVGGARPAMCSWELRPDFIFAWPTAQMVVVGAEGAVDICRKHELKRAEESGEDVAALRAHYIEEYKEEFFNPYKAAEYGKFEDVIEPAESRRVIIRTLELFQNKQVVLPAKKHGNMPV